MAETMRAGELDARQLSCGKPPEDGSLLRQLSIGLDSLTDFLDRIYLKDYIPAGGSKIKLITGHPGSGKTHLARYLTDEAQEQGYVAVRFSARDVWLNDFRSIYLEILRQCDIERILGDCANQIIRELGYDPADIGPGRNFMDSLAERGEGDALSRGEIRGMLRRYFTQNPRLDNTFAACCSLLTGGLLGHPVLESASRELIYAYMNGDKAVKLSQLRAIGLSPSAINRYNARHLLRSLCEVVRLGGHPGLLVVIDDMEALLNRAPGDAIRYTKLRREDTYESIRQLIDDIDSMRNALFLLCFERELMDNDSYGMKSYQALWMRVQNEVVSTRFNRFSDIIDLDRYAEEAYTVPALCEMSERLCLALGEDAGAVPLTPERAEGLAEQARYGRLGLPFMVNRATLEGGEGNV